MSIAELLAVVDPPSEPIDVGDAKQWEAIQAELGIVLPSDYFDFAVHYGTGWFHHQGHPLEDGSAFVNAVFFDVLNPFSAGYCTNVRRRAADMKGAYYTWVLESFPDLERFHFFPQSPGLLPLAHDDNGWDLYWFTDGPPDRWPLLLQFVNDGICSEIAVSSLTTFLARAFSKEWQYPIWEDLDPRFEYFTGGKVKFRQYSPAGFDPAWLSTTVRQLAETIRTERSFDRLPVLGDALEEAGCTHLEFLAHCRGATPHVRGCWLVDFLLRQP
jgi:hypothetical protein